MTDFPTNVRAGDVPEWLKDSPYLSYLRAKLNGEPDPEIPEADDCYRMIASDLTHAIVVAARRHFTGPDRMAIHCRACEINEIESLPACCEALGELWMEVCRGI